MVSTSSVRAATASPVIGAANIQRRIVEALSYVEQVEIADIEGDLAEGGGDLEIDSKTAEVILAKLELDLGVRLVKISELEPEELASVQSLVDLVAKSLGVVGSI